MAAGNSPAREAPTTHELIKARPRDRADIIAIVVEHHGVCGAGHAGEAGRGAVVHVGVGGAVEEEQAVPVLG